MLLARREKDIKLSLYGLLGEFSGKGDEFIGFATHSRNYRNNLMAFYALSLDAVGHIFNAINGPNRGPAVFLDNECHKGVRLPLDGPQIRLFT